MVNVNNNEEAEFKFEMGNMKIGYKTKGTTLGLTIVSTTLVMIICGAFSLAKCYLIKK